MVKKTTGDDARTTLSFGQRLEIYEFLKTVCSKKEGSKYCEFADGWDDQRVADEVAKKAEFTVSKTNVASIRQETIGVIPRGTAVRLATAEVLSRVDACEEMIGNLRQVISGHGQKIEALRKLIESASITRLDRISSAREEIRKLLANGPCRRDLIDRKLKTAGFNEGDIVDALLLGGVTIMKKAQGEVVYPNGSM